MERYLPAMVLLALTAGWVVFIQTLPLKAFLNPEPGISKISDARAPGQFAAFTVVEQSRPH